MRVRTDAARGLDALVSPASPSAPRLALLRLPRERAWIAAPDLVTVVAPVWGRAHLDRFLDVVLPSWLAPGNVPALARGTAGVRILTRRQDEERLRRNPGFVRLRKIAHVEIAPLDDLLSTVGAPVTLTLALQRGVARGAVPGLPRRFLLLNADFALADGALSGALAAWRPDAKLLLAPSLRVTEETIAPRLQELVGRNGVLAAPPRTLARLALDHLHHTVLSSRLDQGLLASTNPHQLYWRVDRGTMIARAFCMFALGVEVDGPPAPAAAFCDYGMGALLTDDDPPVCLGDSDDFLALEIAPRAHEHAFAVHGPPSLDSIARYLDTWTTDFHRRQARARVVCRAADAGPGLAAAEDAADGVVDALLARLGPPQPMRDHPSWISGVAGWRLARRGIGLLDDPPELEAAPDLSPARPAGPPPLVRRLARAVLVGPPERRRPWHPYWRLQKAMRDALGESLWDCRGRTVDVLARAAPWTVEGRLCSFDALARPRARLAGPSAAALLAAVDVSNPTATEAQLAGVRRAGKDAAAVFLLVARPDGGPVPALGAARVFEALDDWLAIESATALALPADAAAETTYGALAERASWRAPWTSLRLLSASAAWWLAVAWSNAAAAFGFARAGAPTAILIRGRRRLE